MADLVVTIEDLVEYEIAIKLKKKGYDMPCDMYYHIHDDIQDCISSLESTGGWCDFYNSKNRYRCAAPSINNVIRWLREEKNIHLIVEIADSGWYYTLYPNVRWEDGKLKSDKYIMSFKNKDSYEDAVLAGIEYVLDNLI